MIITVTAEKKVITKRITGNNNKINRQTKRKRKCIFIYIENTMISVSNVTKSTVILLQINQYNNNDNNKEKHDDDNDCNNNS